MSYLRGTAMRRPDACWSVRWNSVLKFCAEWCQAFPMLQICGLCTLLRCLAACWTLGVEVCVGSLLLMFCLFLCLCCRNCCVLAPCATLACVQVAMGRRLRSAYLGCTAGMLAKHMLHCHMHVRARAATEWAAVCTAAQALTAGFYMAMLVMVDDYTRNRLSHAAGYVWQTC